MGVIDLHGITNFLPWKQKAMQARQRHCYHKYAVQYIYYRCFCVRVLEWDWISLMDGNIMCAGAGQGKKNVWWHVVQCSYTHVYTLPSLSPSLCVRLSVCFCISLSFMYNKSHGIKKSGNLYRHKIIRVWCACFLLVALIRRS